MLLSVGLAFYRYLRMFAFTQSDSIYMFTSSYFAQRKPHSNSFLLHLHILHNESHIHIVSSIYPIALGDVEIDLIMGTNFSLCIMLDVMNYLSLC